MTGSEAEPGLLGLVEDDGVRREKGWREPFNSYLGSNLNTFPPPLLVQKVQGAPGRSQPAE